MKLYEIIKPGDPYTLKAPSFDVAAVAVVVLGEGAYGLQGITDESEQMPAFLLGGAEEWLTEAGLWPLDEFVKSQRSEVRAALDSVLIGSARERTAFDRAMSVVQSAQDRRAAWAEYHDEKRSSLNDIGTKAKRLAQELAGVTE